MKRVGLTVFFLLVLLVVWYWSLIVYGINQGLGQLNIVWNARPIPEVLNDPAFPDSLKSKLRIIDEIKAYAIDSLGLKDTDNYKTVFDQKGQELMWVVTASEPFQLKAKTWDFPVLGTVPYKGYFDKGKAIAEMKQLQEAGWDVGVRNPGGWSTLGWFTDPILSGMLERNEGDLASLIIHEMVHATLFVKDSVDFNENLASFIGDSAAYSFIAAKYGRQSQEYLTYVYEVVDYQRYSNHVLRGSRALDSLYNTFGEGDTDDYKKSKKEEMIQRIVSSMDTLTLHQYKIPTQRFKERPPNNDYFLAYRRYQSKQTNFRLELEEKYNGDLREMIRAYTVRFPFL
ncbi:MAG: aminopeptidase [Cyclobacteriaceae bacterium]|nr:aminopeptidase [Cyclobacteriaceae bacterium]